MNQLTLGPQQVTDLHVWECLSVELAIEAKAALDAAAR